jgi:hypothetical protein
MHLSFYSPELAHKLARLAEAGIRIDSYRMFPQGTSPRGAPVWEFQLLKNGSIRDTLLLEMDTHTLPGLESALFREVLLDTLLSRHRAKWSSFFAPVLRLPDLHAKSSQPATESWYAPLQAIDSLPENFEPESLWDEILWNRDSGTNGC